jgi:hypothetical protein
LRKDRKDFFFLRKSKKQTKETKKRHKTIRMFIILAVLYLIHIACLEAISFHQKHPFIEAIHRQNVKKPVRFGSLSVEVNEEDLLHHHRQLKSNIHESLQTRLIYLPEQWPHVEEGEIIEFELFDGIVAIGRTESLAYRSESSVGWNGDIRISTGRLMDDLKISDGYFGLSCFQKACVANIQIYSTNQEFNIAPSGIPLSENGEGIYAISEVALDNLKRTGTTSKHHLVGSNYSISSSSAHHLDHSNLRGVPLASKRPTINIQFVDTDNIVDLLVLYTAEATGYNAGTR